MLVREWSTRAALFCIAYVCLLDHDACRLRIMLLLRARTVDVVEVVALSSIIFIDLFFPASGLRWEGILSAHIIVCIWFLLALLLFIEGSIPDWSHRWSRHAFRGRTGVCAEV